MKSTTEYEANIFGSHLLIDNDEVLALARYGYDIWRTIQEANYVREALTI